MDPVVLRKGENAKAAVTRCPQRRAEFGFVHAEPARSTACSGEIHVALDDICTAQPPGLELAKVADQIPNREVNRIAETGGAELLPDLVSGAIGFGKDQATKPRARQESFYQPFMLPCE